MVCSVLYGMGVTMLALGFFTTEEQSGVLLYWAHMPTIWIILKVWGHIPDWISLMMLSGANILVVFCIVVGCTSIVQKLRKRDDGKIPEPAP